MHNKYGLHGWDAFLLITSNCFIQIFIFSLKIHAFNLDSISDKSYDIVRLTSQLLGNQW